MAYLLGKGAHRLRSSSTTAVLSRKQQRTSSMKTRNKLVVTVAALALAIGVGTYAFKASSQEGGPGFGPRFMHGMGHGSGIMGMGHDMMGAGSGSATTAEMGVIHELIVNHDRIRRTVTNLPDGIRTVTESDDPQISRILKEHVASMGRRE